MLIPFLIFILFIWGITLLIGSLLPKAFISQYAETLEATPSVIWAIITNHAREKDWRSDLMEVGKLPNQDDKPVWRELRRDRNEFKIQTISSDAPNRLVRKIIANKKMGGQYIYEINQVEQGAILKVTFEGIINGAFARFKAWLFPSIKNRYVKQYISDVKQRLIYQSEEE